MTNGNSCSSVTVANEVCGLNALPRFLMFPALVVRLSIVGRDELEHLSALGAHMLRSSLELEPHQSVLAIVASLASSDTRVERRVDADGVGHRAERTHRGLIVEAAHASKLQKELLMLTTANLLNGTGKRKKEKKFQSSDNRRGDGRLSAGVVCLL